MAEYLIIELKIGVVRSLDELPRVTADDPVTAVRSYAEQIQRDGSFYAVPADALSTVQVTSHVERTYEAQLVSSSAAPAA